MNKLTTFIGPLVLGALIAVGINNFSSWMSPEADAVSIVTTFTDGNVLTAAQLNGNNTAIFNAFNAHDHDGGDGEPSTLSPSAIDTALDFTSNSDIEVGDGASTSTGASAAGITVKADTGDARLSLKVNDAAANTWDIYNDNSDLDQLHFDYNGANILRFATSDLASGTTPTVDTLYQNMIIKAWASTASGATINDGANLTVASGGTGIYNYTFRTAMENANYAVTATALTGAGAFIAQVGTVATTGFTLHIRSSGSVLTDLQHYVMVVGDN